MRTNVVIDDTLMAQAQKAANLKTKKDTIEAGLKMLIRILNQKKLLKYQGKLKWTGDLDKLRENRI